MSTAPIRDRLVKALEPVVATHGLDLEEVHVTPAGRRRLVRVIVDKDSGVTLDDISDATRAVSRHLDDADLMEDRPYTLEVTSPGTDRPLSKPRHWRRNVGRLVRIVQRDGESVTGRIADASATSARVEVDGSDRQIAYDEVAKALIQVEFERRRD